MFSWSEPSQHTQKKTNQNGSEVIFIQRLDLLSYEVEPYTRTQLFKDSETLPQLFKDSETLTIHKNTIIQRLDLVSYEVELIIQRLDLISYEIELIIK